MGPSGPRLALTRAKKPRNQAVFELRGFLKEGAADGVGPPLVPRSTLNEGGSFYIKGEARISDVVERLAGDFALSADERSHLLPSGRQTAFANRVHWAKKAIWARPG